MEGQSSKWAPAHIGEETAIICAPDFKLKWTHNPTSPFCENVHSRAVREEEWWLGDSVEEGMPPLPSVEKLVYIFHKCTKERNIAHALRLHHYMCKSGLEFHRSLGGYFVSMLVEVGSMFDAHKVFDRLVPRNECSWNSLIIGYIKCGDSQRALILYQKMQEDSLNPNMYTLAALLKACGELMDVQRGCKIHAEITRKGLLERDLFVGNTLVDMYVKCGSLAEAQAVFDELQVRDVVSWNVLITGYVKHERGEEALNYFEHMQLEGVSPNAVTFVCSLKACGSIGAIDKGQEIHVKISRKGLLQRDLVVGNALVDMYAKCGSLAQAQEVFDKLAVRDVISWNALMAGYAKHECGEEVLNCFEQMQLEGVSPDAVSYVCGLKACGSIGATAKGGKIHAEIARKGLLERDAVVGKALLDMYAKCGSFAKAQEVFDKLLVRDVVSWTALIAGYAKHDHGEDALYYFEQMQHEGVFPNAATFVCSLKACGSIRATDKGREIHVKIAITGLLESNLVVGNALVDMYAKCGLLGKAQDVFDELPVRDIVSWNALITGYAKEERGKEALNCLEQMQLEGVFPDAVTFVCSLKACGTIGATDKGGELHAEISRNGLLERDIVVGNALVDMYAKCGSFAKARDLFDKLPVRDVVSWTALMAGYAKQERGEEVLNCFEQMQIKGVPPDAVTFVCILKACGINGATDKGREIHVDIARKGLLERNLLVGSALVDMYSKCGWLAKAQEVFDKLSIRDVVLWTALLSGYAKHVGGKEALNCFEQMELEGVSPDVVTFICSLKACGSIGATDKGKEIHAEIASKGLLERDLVVGNALINMYAKCGLLAKAQEVFNKLPVRDVISWNALIAGYAQLGEVENVFHILNRMTGEGEKPNLVTFVGVLNACSHVGLVDKGQAYFEAMSKDYGISPTLEHHTCMIDLLSRAGHLDRLAVMIRKMPFHADIVVWHTVLDACQKWGNVELGRKAFRHAVRLDEKDAAAYVCMCNIHADADMQEDANKVGAMRMRKQVWTKPEDYCWTDADRIVHLFLVRGKDHSQSRNIFTKLEDHALNVQDEGHLLGLPWVSGKISGDRKLDVLCGHSEKLAISCALFNTPKGTPICVV